jgi:pimeloyl-ACP methyl ester carboxylesterase
MPEFARGDATIHFEDTGSGSPLLLIPGIGSDGASWLPVTVPLAERCRLIVINSRGCGQTRCEGPITIADLVDDCVALLDHLGLATSDVVGHSLGGLIALRVAVRHPARVNRLVVVTATPSLTMKQMLLFEEQVQLKNVLSPERYFAQLFQWMRSEAFFEDPAEVARIAQAAAQYAYGQSPADFARQVDALHTLDSIDVTKISCPMLALAAERDILFPAASVVAAYQAVPSARIEVIAGTAHSVAESPDKVTAALTRFLT